MSEATEDVFKFVLLIEQHTNVLLKSQTKLNKKKKEEAGDSIISKWQEISGTKLTHVTLFKKISNLKTRAKSELKSGKPVNEWQAKILEITNDGKNHVEDSSPSNPVRGTASETLIAATDAEQILNKFETDETKLMSLEQLQRYVLLQQAHVLTLQRKRLEHLQNIEIGKNVTIDYIGFDDDIDGSGNQPIANL